MADVLVLGATSMVGSHFVANSSLRIAAAGRNDPRTGGLTVDRFDSVDISNADAVQAVVEAAPEPVVINFAARTDVDTIESERAGAGASERGDAWRINALAPRAMALASRRSKKYMVQVSTDFVFDGLDGPYREDSPVSPLSPRLNWYGWTKSEGERLAQFEFDGLAVVRIGFPYRSRFPSKLDFARRILQLRRQGSLSPLYGDQQLSPTWIPDLTRALHLLVKDQRPGVFHIASPKLTTPHEFGTTLIGQVEGVVPSLVVGTIAAASPGRAPRPAKGGLLTGRSAELGLRLTPWDEGIRELVAEEGWNQ